MYSTGRPTDCLGNKIEFSAAADLEPLIRDDVGSYFVRVPGIVLRTEPSMGLFDIDPSTQIGAIHNRICKDSF